MNSAARSTALGVLLLMAALVGAALILVPGMVEDACRRSLAELPQALAAEGIALDQPEVRQVRFSLFSRELVLDRLRLQGKLVQKGKAESGGSFLASSDEIVARLSFRGLLLATPLASYLLPAARLGAELYPLLDSLEAKETAIAVAEPSLALNISASVIQAHDVAVDSALLRTLLDGSMSSSQPSAQRSPDGLDWLYGFAAANLNLTGPDLSLDAPVTSESLSARCAELAFKGLVRRRLAGQEVRDLSCTLPDGRRLTIAQLREEAIALPEKGRLQRLIRELNLPEPSEKRYAKALKTALSSPEPLVGKTMLSGLVLPLNSTDENAVRLERAVLDWRSAKPLNQQLAITGLSMPATLLAQELGFTLPALPLLTLDATLSILGTGPATPEQHQGSLTARNLCTLVYDFTLDPLGRKADLNFLRGTFSAATLRYTDEGLLPRLALGIIPLPEAAALALKVGLAHICSEPTPENAALRAALETFIERPGSLLLKARKPFTLLEAMTLTGEGNAGALVSASATAGPQSLGQAMTRISRQGR